MERYQCEVELSSMCIVCKPSVSSAVTHCVCRCFYFDVVLCIFDRKSVLLYAVHGSICLNHCASHMHLPVRLDSRSNTTHSIRQTALKFLYL